MIGNFASRTIASKQPHVRKILEGEARAEPRIKLVFREENGNISAASNSALALATGDFLVSARS